MTGIRSVLRSAGKDDLMYCGHRFRIGQPPPQQNGGLHDKDPGPMEELGILGVNQDKLTMLVSWLHNSNVCCQLYINTTCITQ